MSEGIYRVKEDRVDWIVRIKGMGVKGKVLSVKGDQLVVQWDRGFTSTISEHLVERIREND